MGNFFLERAFWAFIALATSLIAVIYKLYSTLAKKDLEIAKNEVLRDVREIELPVIKRDIDHLKLKHLDLEKNLNEVVLKFTYSKTSEGLSKKDRAAISKIIKKELAEDDKKN